VAVFTPEQCLAMVLIKLKQITELQDVKIRVTDCVISVRGDVTGRIIRITDSMPSD
jgi:hypothetical protein